MWLPDCRAAPQENQSWMTMKKTARAGKCLAMAPQRASWDGATHASEPSRSREAQLSVQSRKKRVVCGGCLHVEGDIWGDVAILEQWYRANMKVG